MPGDRKGAMTRDALVALYRNKINDDGHRSFIISDISMHLQN